MLHVVSGKKKMQCFYLEGNTNFSWKKKMVANMSTIAFFFSSNKA